MGETLVGTLIQAARALLGALIGFGGSLLVSNRTARASLEQIREEVRYSKAHEHRDEALAEIFGMLRDIEEKYRWFVSWLEVADIAREASSRGSHDKIVKIHDDLDTRIGEFQSYYFKHSIWIPDNLSGALLPILDPVFKTYMKLFNEWERWDKEVNRNEPMPQGAVEEARYWLRKEFRPKMDTLSTFT